MFEFAASLGYVVGQQPHLVDKVRDCPDGMGQTGLIETAFTQVDPSLIAVEDAHGHRAWTASDDQFGLVAKAHLGAGDRREPISGR